MKKELTWEEHIDRCSQLGLSKKAYCEKNKLSYALFFYHQRKINEGRKFDVFKEVMVDGNQLVQPEGGNYTLADSVVLQVQFINGSTLHFPEHLLERVVCLLQRQSE
jgi:hypothetical protein